MDKSIQIEIWTNGENCRFLHLVHLLRSSEYHDKDIIGIESFSCSGHNGGIDVVFYSYYDEPDSIVKQMMNDPICQYACTHTIITYSSEIKKIPEVKFKPVIWEKG